MSERNNNYIINNVSKHCPVNFIIDDTTESMNGLRGATSDILCIEIRFLGISIANNFNEITNLAQKYQCFAVNSNCQEPKINELSQLLKTLVMEKDKLNNLSSENNYNAPSFKLFMETSSQLTDFANNNSNIITSTFENRFNILEDGLKLFGIGVFFGGVIAKIIHYNELAKSIKPFSLFSAVSVSVTAGLYSFMQYHNQAINKINTIQHNNEYIEKKLLEIGKELLSHNMELE